MTAAYPASIPPWSTKRNYLDIVWADHVNRLQEETQAIQTTLGIIPQRATANPGSLTPDYGTVANRIQAVARGEQIPYFRGSLRDYKIDPNVWSRPSLRADDDPYGMYAGTGIRLNESGTWLITIKVDRRATTDTTRLGAVHLARLEIDGSDVGVRDVLEETQANRLALHQHITWEENLAKNTVIAVAVRSNIFGSSAQLASHVYMRAHLVRCAPYTGEGGSLPFDPIPDQPPEEQPPITVITPPPAERNFTVYCVYGGLNNYATDQGGGKGWSLIDVRVIDNSNSMFAKSTHPKFATWDQADAYRDQLWQELTGNGRVWGETISDTATGTHWPSI